MAREFPMEHDDSHEDYITWLKILRKYGCAAGINKPYLKYRLSEGGKSRNKLKSAAMTYNVYRYAGYGRIRSCIFFCSYAVHGIWKYFVTVHTPLSREVFWHEYAKIPRHTSQNSIAAGNLE